MALKHVAAPLISGALFGSFLHRLAVCRVIRVGWRRKGGQTPTTVLLSAVFARYGGAGVVAWDANQTRGTLG